MESDEVPRGNETILLVEPEAETRKLAAFMLSKQGYTVVEARSGAEALQLYQERGGGIDLLLTEDLLPAVNGREVARILTTKAPYLRAIYLCGAQTKPSRRRKTEMLQRPFTMRVLAEKVRRALDQPRPRVMTAGG